MIQTDPDLDPQHWLEEDILEDDDVSRDVVLLRLFPSIRTQTVKHFLEPPIKVSKDANDQPTVFASNIHFLHSKKCVTCL